MSETASWDALPAEEHQYVWDEAESKFWRDFDSEQEAQHTKAEQGYQTALTAIKVELGTLDGKRDELNRVRERLAQELRNVEQELAAVVASCDEKANKMTVLQQTYRHEEQDRLEQREKVMATMVRWFREKRGHDVSESDDDVADVSDVRNRHNSSDRGATPMDGVEYSAVPEKAPPRPIPRTPVTPIIPAAPANNASKSADKLVDIVDADGQVIGPVEKIEPWNQWVKAILPMPVVRPVKIRRGRKFTPGHAAGIYERAEAKGVKWLSCMIQAIGEVQEQRCISCDKNQGAFDDCIIIGGPLFQKCGNCEWNRQGCHGAAAHRGNGIEGGERIVVEAEDAANDVEVEDEDAATQAEKDARHAEDAADLKARRHRAAQEALAKASGLAQEAAHLPPTPLRSANSKHSDHDEHFGSSSTPLHSNAPTPIEPRTSGFTPANISSRPQSRDVNTPTIRSFEPTPQPVDHGDEDLDLPPITRNRLDLKHNGREYIYPEIVQGVPLEKIDQNHPYWDPKWPDIRALIEPPLQKWQERLQRAVEAKERGGDASSRFQLGRQVNRGHKILEFLENGEINPYQLLSKKYTTSGKGSITSYDTLFRLCETLSELSKYGLDIQPVDWMRQRLHELWLEQGTSFNVSKIIHNFYNDPKLSVLRAKAGFKNIGRPSGGKVGRHSTGATPTLQPRKRKSTHNLNESAMDLDTSSLEKTPEVGNGGSVSFPTSPSSLSANKRLKPLSPAPPRPSNPDMDGPADFTDTDSYCGAPTADCDFRVYQIKSRVYTSSSQVTQYLHWVKNERYLEHQVLKEMEPIQWAVHKQPIDFEVRVDDVVLLGWNVNALRVHLGMNPHSKQISKKDGQPRGDVMVAFKRERTLRRFVRLVESLRIPTKETSTEEMESRWMKMQSERLPDAEEEASEELKE